MDTLYRELSDKLNLSIIIDYLLYSGSLTRTEARPTEEDAWTDLQRYLEQQGLADGELLDRLTAFISLIQEHYLLAGIKLGAQMADEFSLTPQDVERVEQVLVTNADKDAVLKEVALKLRTHYLHTADADTRQLLADIDVLLQTILV